MTPNYLGFGSGVGFKLIVELSEYFTTFNKKKYLFSKQIKILEKLSSVVSKNVLSLLEL